MGNRIYVIFDNGFWWRRKAEEREGEKIETERGGLLWMDIVDDLQRFFVFIPIICSSEEGNWGGGERERESPIEPLYVALDY